jgi:formylglycine-generating enzyme required for sulfatase activity
MDTMQFFAVLLAFVKNVTIKTSRAFDGYFINLSLLFVIVFGGVSHVYASEADDKMLAIGKVLFDRTEVTIEDFSIYVAATKVITSSEKSGEGLVYGNGWERKPDWYWKKPFGTETNPKLPAVHITFDEAESYCQWAGKRLPTDIEWQNAAYTESRSQPPAGFEQGRTYPYPTGMTPIGANCLNDCGKTTALDFSAFINRGIGPAPVATSAVGVNGLYDMGANVWEWTVLGDKRNDNHNITNQKTNQGANQGTRGGSWWYGKTQMSRDYNETKRRDLAVVYVGFRCARDIK